MGMRRVSQAGTRRFFLCIRVPILQGMRFTETAAMPVVEAMPAAGVEVAEMRAEVMQVVETLRGATHRAPEHDQARQVGTEEAPTEVVPGSSGRQAFEEDSA